MTRVSLASADDCERLIRLWDLLFDQAGVDGGDADWKSNAREWFTRVVDDPTAARIPVIEVRGTIVATAVGVLEIGVPNPHCPRGRAVRLQNVITLSEYRRQGFGKALVTDVVVWARSIGADRVDLSATPHGQHLYQSLGFAHTSAPRMKLVL